MLKLPGQQTPWRPAPQTFDARNLPRVFPAARAPRPILPNWPEDRPQMTREEAVRAAVARGEMSPRALGEEPPATPQPEPAPRYLPPQMSADDNGEPLPPLPAAVPPKAESKTRTTLASAPKRWDAPSDFEKWVSRIEPDALTSWQEQTGGGTLALLDAFNDQHERTAT
jgi:hypothetical protein